MLTMLILLLSFVNFILITGIILYYFKTHFIIIDKESWDIISEFVVEHQQQEIEGTIEELPGGNGFFREYVEEEDEEE